jgi:hypothetical protein
MKNQKTFTHFYFHDYPYKKGKPIVDTMEIPIELYDKYKSKFGKDILSANKQIIEEWLKNI